MSGWEAMQQGAPDPFFAEGRGNYFCPRGHLHSEAANFCTVCGAGPVLRSHPDRQILGSGREDFTPCDGCPDDICALAKACVRAKAKL